MDETDIRVGIVGYGLAGAAFHAPLVAVTPGLRLAGIVTANPARREAATARYPDARIVAGVDELLALDGLQLVVVATPNRSHLAIASAALHAGMHVVADKPLCTTSAEARMLIARAREAGRMLTVFQNRRLDADARTLAALLQAGTLGAVHRFESRFERWRPQVKPGWRELPDPEEGGGILLDLGTHLVDQALHLFGPARLEHAELAALRPGARTDDDAFLVLHHASGTRSHLWMSALAAQPGPRMRVLGSRGAWVTWGMDTQEELLRAGELPAGDGWGEVPREAWGLLGAADEVTVHEPVPGDYRLFYADVVRCLRDGTPPPVDDADALAVLELLEAARERAT